MVAAVTGGGGRRRFRGNSVFKTPGARRRRGARPTCGAFAGKDAVEVVSTVFTGVVRATRTLRASAVFKTAAVRRLRGGAGTVFAGTGAAEAASSGREIALRLGLGFRRTTGLASCELGRRLTANLTATVGVGSEVIGKSATDLARLARRFTGFFGVAAVFVATRRSAGLAALRRVPARARVLALVPISSRCVCWRADYARAAAVANPFSTDFQPRIEGLPAEAGRIQFRTATFCGMLGALWAWENAVRPANGPCSFCFSTI